jgi:hypothetical protein
MEFCIKYLMMKHFTRLGILVALFCTQVSFAQKAYDFNGTNQYVTFGVADSLGAARFTLECWFYKKGTGKSTTSGSGGITTIIPLISKGRGEADGTTTDMNYIFGINSTTNVLCADFEEGAGMPSVGLNHPVSGTTTILNNQWYHAAVTFDGAKWRIYLNGVLEKTDSIGVLPRSNSIQHAGLATAMTSTGTPDGYFQGILDEVRIWNYARSEKELRDSINTQVPTATGLIGRWGMDDVSGTVLTGKGKFNINGTIVNGATASSTGSPFDATFPAPNLPPNQPTVFTPKDSTVNYSDSMLSVIVSDPELNKMKVTFLGRKHEPMMDSGKFTIIPIPDVQFYTAHMNGGTNETFKAQTKWITDSIATKNIVYTVQLGDCVQNGDNGGDNIEWKRADTSFKIIENPATTMLKYGLPYGICVGNHDQSPGGDASGATLFYNSFFGSGRFAGRDYYGGHYGVNNDNHFQLFSARGMDFIALSFEYDPLANASVLNWADSLLKAYPKRRAIVSSHWIINSDGSFGAQGAAIYNKLKENANLGLMLCGHINPGGEARRSDTYKGNTVHTLLSDFQDRANGGSGWLRIMEFFPSTNTIEVKTYSPTLNKYETDANSEFTLSYPMTKAFDTIGIIFNAPSASAPSVIWNGLEDSARYDWYVVINDGVNPIKTSVKTFTYLKNPPTTGMKDPLNLTNSLELFPNPNDGKMITLHYPEKVNVTVRITDMSGRVVYNDTLELNGNTVLPVMVERGTYIISVNAKGQLMNKKLVVQ